MARKSPTASVSPSESASPDSLSVTLTQQCLHVLRQLIQAQGWAKGIMDIYNGGKLLSETLPTVDDTSWVLSEKEILALDAEGRKAYLSKDREWSEKTFTFTISQPERDAIERAFQHNVSELVKVGKLGPNPVLFELIKVLSIKEAPVEAKAD